MPSKEVDPKMHTAEHILNRTMIELFGCGRCFSAHIEKKKSKCDYYFDKELSNEQLRQIEDKVNEVIRQDLPVREMYMEREEAREKCHPAKLPESSDPDLRVIKVGEYDLCPCLGPHVTSTSELGSFKLVSADLSHGVLRIRYKLFY
jgi:alanyl-tRNA synthetase